MQNIQNNFKRNKNKIKKTITPQIQAIYWNGDPDIDAVSRLFSNIYKED